MTFEWSEFLEVAKFLDTHGNPSFSDEAATRCVVSRGYYAAFGTSREYARKIGWIFPETKSIHKEVKEKFRKDGNRAHRTVGFKLEQLIGWRVQCDYEKQLNSNLDSLRANSIKEAEEIITLLKST